MELNRSLFSSLRILPLAAVVFTTSLLAGPTAPDESTARWEEILAMDAGPKGTPGNREEAAEQTRIHILNHQQLLAKFIADFPGNPREFEARLRLAGLTASLGTLVGNPQSIEKAYRQLTDLERARGITRAQAADAGFQKVSVLFLKARGQEDRMRESLVNSATNFHSRYPGDPRGPRLLAEVAGICDSIPRTKRALLETALRDTRDESLKARVADDLLRLDLLGQRVPLTFPTLQHGTFDIHDYRGKICIVVFWSSDSPHSLVWMDEFLKQAARFPKDKVGIAFFGLDNSRPQLEQMVQELEIKSPVGFDGKGWQSPIARLNGINAVPTVWVFDRFGRLRSSNARQDYLSLIRRLETERN